MTRFLGVVCSLSLVAASAAAQTVTGSGTTNTLPVFTGASTVGNSPISVSGGNVGIGTTSPGAGLTLGPYGNSTTHYVFLAQPWDSTSGYADFVGDWNSYGWWGIGPLDGSASNTLRIGNVAGNGAQYTGTWASTQDLNLVVGGNLGIGTMNPGAKLDVASGFPGQTGPVVGIQIDGPNSPTNSNGAQDIEFGFSAAGSARIRAYRGGSWDTYLEFLTNAYSQGSDSPQVRMTIDGTGNVGIGTTSPGAKLEVNGGLRFTNDPSGAVQTTAWTGVLCGGDYAEAVNVTGDRRNFGPGDVLVIDPENPDKFLKSAEPYSTAVLGVYSTKPGVLGRHQTGPKNPDEVPMAMVGIVPTKVSAENGAIRPGDLLVSSSTPGYAMKGTDRSRMLGAVIGKALGRLDSGTGVIEVGVTLQ